MLCSSYTSTAHNSALYVSVSNIILQDTIAHYVFLYRCISFCHRKFQFYENKRNFISNVWKQTWMSEYPKKAMKLIVISLIPFEVVFSSPLSQQSRRFVVRLICVIRKLFQFRTYGNQHIQRGQLLPEAGQDGLVQQFKAIHFSKYIFILGCLDLTYLSRDYSLYVLFDLMPLRPIRVISYGESFVTSML